jgi:hypothetical protein
MVCRVRSEFQESGFSYLLHISVLVHSLGIVSGFFAKQGIPMLFHPPYSPYLEPADLIY